MNSNRPFRTAPLFALALSTTALCLNFAVPSVVVAAEESAASAADSTMVGTIVVKGFMFAPASVTVKAGTRVTWINKDEEPHTVASNEGVFRSAALDTDESFSYQFNKPGTYHYTCTIHPRMIGTITVE